MSLTSPEVRNLKKQLKEAVEVLLEEKEADQKLARLVDCQMITSRLFSLLSSSSSLDLDFEILTDEQAQFFKELHPYVVDEANARVKLSLSVDPGELKGRLFEEHTRSAEMKVCPVTGVSIEQSQKVKDAVKRWRKEMQADEECITLLRMMSSQSIPLQVVGANTLLANPVKFSHSFGNLPGAMPVLLNAITGPLNCHQIQFFNFILQMATAQLILNNNEIVAGILDGPGGSESVIVKYVCSALDQLKLVEPDILREVPPVPGAMVSDESVEDEFVGALSLFSKDETDFKQHIAVCNETIQNICTHDLDDLPDDVQEGYIKLKIMFETLATRGVKDGRGCKRQRT